MPRPRRRRTWFWSWWPCFRCTTASKATSRRIESTPAGSALPPWANDPTANLPNLRYAPLLTRAQAYRGNGGRWTR
jgi:hypothetical protein